MGRVMTAYTTNTPLAQFAREAQQKLKPEIWQYLQEGSGAHITVEANAQAWSRHTLMPRPLVNIQVASTHCRMFKETWLHPIVLAPIAYQRLFHVDGESASAMAANAQDGQMMVSSLASQSLETIIDSAGQALWFQLYWQGSRERTLRLLKCAIAAGYGAVVFTVDAPVKQAGLVLPPDVSAVNLEQPLRVESGAGQRSQVFDGWMAQAPNWDDVQWLREQTPLPLVIKGLLHLEDVERAVRYGAEGVVISNHGGRVLDNVPTVPDVLPAIVQAFGGKVKILADSGLRTGHDVYQALAMGADAVLLGRPYIWGLAAHGAMGVAQVIRCVRDELEMTMALTGVSQLSGIRRL